MNFMKKVRIIFAVFIVLLLIQCATVPVTGQKQLLVYPDRDMLTQSLTAYRDFLKENKLSMDMESTRRVKAVGARIAKSVEEYLRSKGQETLVTDFNWEFNLVQSLEPNAWCMPGGKVVFYEGILPYCKNDDGIAVVMGHEIAHAVARYGNERMSQQLLLQTGSEIAAGALTKDKSETTQAMVLTAFGVGTNLGVVLPFSRKQENEADKMGLIFMTMAGYSPEEAIAFWTRMASMEGGKKAPEFLSTHPADEKRIANIKAAMPEVLQYKK